MSKKSYSLTIRSLLVLCLCSAILGTITTRAVHADQASGEEGDRASGPLVKREHRRTLFSSDDGEISAVRVADNINGSYLLHFFTLEPNSLFLPAVLHADMVFYVHTGSGKLSWTEEDDVKSTEITRGDVYRLEQGAIFFIQSNLDTDNERQKLRIHAIFPNSKNDLHEPATGPYSSIRDMVLGFDKQVLQAAFKVPEEVIDELSNGKNPPAIVHGLPRTKKAGLEMEAQFVKSLLGRISHDNILFELNKKKKKKSSAKLFNLFKEDKDFENCNGWSTTVTRTKLSALKGSGIGLFMVNLTAGSMMGPHWNPKATEIAVVLQGRGMIRVVCSSISDEKQCRNLRFEVEQGDVFAVPRFHPMAQISFNNETLVFMGFSTWAKKNHPQFLAGGASVFRSLDKDVLAMSFNITNTTVDQLLAPQHDSVILGCVSCAEEELRILEEEIERKREKAREREEEETRRREEEAARKREEEAARREEEEKRHREEEEEQEAAAKRREEKEERERREHDERERREEEEERKRKEEEEEAARREEEARQREQEERERREEEEEERKREEEVSRREEEARQREQEERERREEETRRREQEQERKREEEVARREEEERQREEEEEAARQREEEEEARQMEKEREKEAAEEERIRREQEERQREQEHKEQEEATRQRQEQEEETRKEEQERRGRSEEEWAEEEERRREEEAQRQEQEEETRREEQERRGRSEQERAEEEERRKEEEAQREEEGEEERGSGEGGETSENLGGKGWERILLKKRLTV
ncbi:hypothetical protein OROHE_017223 [Orobanche hederae]